MGNLDHFNLAELGTFVGIVASAIAGSTPRIPARLDIESSPEQEN